MYRGLVSRTRHHIATIRTSCKHHCLSCSRKFKFLLQTYGLERVRKHNQTIWPSFEQHLSEIPRFEVPRSSIFWNSLSIAVFGVEFVEHYSSWWPSPAPSSMVLRNYYRIYRFFTHFQNSRSCILESCNSLNFCASRRWVRFRVWILWDFFISMLRGPHPHQALQCSTPEDSSSLSYRGELDEHRILEIM